MEKMLDIGNGLKIAKVNIEELREHDLNARSMNSAMFERLTANIKKDNRLESLPFVAETENGIEIVSGHHRVRACRSAGITEIFVILDDTGLDRNKMPGTRSAALIIRQNSRKSTQTQKARWQSNFRPAMKYPATLQ